MRLAERCRDPSEFAELQRLFLDQPRSGNRRYIENGSDEFTLVCRFVFADLRSGTERSNASRYAHCLREAAKRQIGSATLVEFLKEEGGINALFLGRPLSRQTVTTKTLRLTEPITVGKGVKFTVTLIRNPDNTYSVIEGP
ncbi:hypothetical protein [Microvirga massiliensis]|uniref:hypothetical protein n=1 Tax=Microvirga massiliensis TaxID=1033741 RepID=UPI0011CA5694|nr:hypothetical protein [Microvirga massiliensis]